MTSVDVARCLHLVEVGWMTTELLKLQLLEKHPGIVLSSSSFCPAFQSFSIQFLLPIPNLHLLFSHLQHFSPLLLLFGRSHETSVTDVLIKHEVQV